jgi:hypothetical protein
VACLRSRELVDEQGAVCTLFSTPIENVDTEVLVADHGHLVSDRSAVAQVAAWLDRHLAG